MRYLPLIWAALWRRPMHLVLTLLSVTAAFALFGMVIGFNASMQRLANIARPNFVYVNSRFGTPLPLSFEDQIARLPGVAKVAYLGGLEGYYRDKKNFVFPIMLGAGSEYVMTIFPLAPARWTQLRSSRTNVFVSRKIAERYHLMAGDALPVMVAGQSRQDGSGYWPFTVAGVIDDVPQYLNGFVIGNYNYLDEARPVAQRGTVLQFQLLVRDPNRASATARAIDVMFANSGVPTNSITEKESYASAAQANINIPFVTSVVAAAALFMILFLAGNGIAESVQERVPELALLKTLGFSNRAIMAMVFIEGAVPCVIGALIGLVTAAIFAEQVPKLTPPNANNFVLPVPYMSATVFAIALGLALLLAVLSTAIPILFVRRLTIVTALARRRTC